MKTYDPNNMVIDYLFKAIDKKRRKKEEKEKKKALSLKNDNHNNDECYTIEINL